MREWNLPAAITLLLCLPVGVCAQLTVVGSPHDLNPIYTTSGRICWYCHTPHTASPAAPLWNRQNPTGGNYTIYETNTLDTPPGQPTGASLLCLSCHDGTIAVNLTYHDQLFGGGESPAFIGSSGDLGENLSDDHPISITYPNSARFKQPPPSIIQLESGKVQCHSCHDPHDNSNGDFLVMSNIQSALCQSCHEQGAGWISSSHATSIATWNGSGTDPWPSSTATTPQANACANCHVPHGSGDWLLVRGGEESLCFTCHNGNVATQDVRSDFQRPYTHPVESYTSLHEPGEPALLDPVNGTTRHVECTDCHHPHEALSNDPLAGIMGVEVDGTYPVPVTSESDLCYRCHGDSSDKPSPSVQRLVVQNNIRLKFQTGNISFHPVEGPRNSPDVPSLLDSWNSGSTMTCTDCHAGNDAASSSGGSRTASPHGSMYPHILKRSYRMGSHNSNYNSSDYELCWQCHDRNVFEAGDTFKDHKKHVRWVGCSVCHDPHGINSEDPNADPIRNRQLINFDTTVVLPVGNNPLPYWVDTNTSAGQFEGECYLVCHNKKHNPKNY